MKSTWQPSHRALVRLGDPGSFLGVHVMQTEDGGAYTRFAWMQGLKPTLRRDPRGEWVVGDAGQIGEGVSVVVRVDSLEEVSAA